METYKNLAAGRPVKPTPDSEIVYSAIPTPNLVILEVSLDRSRNMGRLSDRDSGAVFLLPSNERHS